MSDKPAVQNVPDNNIINNIINVFKSKLRKIVIIIAKIQKILKNGQIVYDLSDKPAVQNAPDNNIINDIINVFKSTYNNYCWVSPNLPLCTHPTENPQIKSLSKL